MGEVPIRPSFISSDTREGKCLFLDLNPHRGDDFALVSAGREVCTPNYRVEQPGFEYHTVELVVGGSWQLDCRAGSKVLRPVALLAHSSGIVYSLVAGEGMELIECFVNFTGRAADRWIERCGLAESAVLFVQQMRWIHDLFDQLIDCSRLAPRDRTGTRSRHGETDPHADPT